MNNQHWYIVAKTDTRARLLADRHYSRQSVGSKQFTPPGNVIVLIIPSGFTAAALWVSQRPDPSAGLDKRKDGYIYWSNSYFRNESGLQSSGLIVEAMRITKYFWGDLIPKHGFHSFVDPSKVRGVKCRGETIHGFSFLKAGYKRAPEITQNRKLIRWIYSADKIRELQGLKPLQEQMLLFA